MANTTQTALSQLTAAREKLYAAEAEENRLYAVYQGFPLTTPPDVVSEARDAYLRAGNVTLAAAAQLARVLRACYGK